MLIISFLTNIRSRRKFIYQTIQTTQKGYFEIKIEDI